MLRYWGALGLAMLGDCGDAGDGLRALMTNDSSPQVRVVAAEALLCAGHAEGTIAALAQLAGEDHYPRVRLAAVNVLTRAGEAARPALPQLQAATTAADEYLPNAARYYLQHLDGTYDPKQPVYAFRAVQQTAQRVGIQP